MIGRELEPLGDEDGKWLAVDLNRSGKVAGSTP
jgi:hypothetical protein